MGYPLKTQLVLVSFRHVKTKTKKDEEESDDSDLDDEEVSLGSMDEEDFGEELEDEGGMFMDPDDGDDEGRPSLCEPSRLTSVTASAKPSCLQII